MGLLTSVSSQINRELWSLQQPVNGDQIYLILGSYIGVNQIFTNNNTNQCSVCVNNQHTYLYIVFIMYK